MGPYPGWLPTSEFTRVLAGIDGTGDRCAAFAAMCRVNTLYAVMRAGSGHLGSSFSAADVVSRLLLAELRRPFTADGDLYFSSKGHDVPGLYAAMIGLGVLDEGLLHRLRRLGGLPGHPDVHTPWMPFNTGSLGMGVSKAKGLILGDRIRGRSRRVFVLTGDGELQEGQNWEALAGAAHAGLHELTVLVDHNTLQSDTWVRDVSDLGDLVAKFRAFGWGVLRCDGNDSAEVGGALRERAARFGAGPAVIIADTVKGAGCELLAATSMPEGEWRYRYHSGAPALSEYLIAHEQLVTAADEVLARHGLDPLRPAGTDLPRRAAGTAPRLPQVYGEALTALAATDERVVALDADLLLDTGLGPFAEAFPQRLVECGIAEQDMVSMAGGLAAAGLLPFVHSFSCFLHARPNEHIYNNATEGRRIVYVGSLAGVLPAGPGHSHQAVRDVSAVGAVPGLLVLAPAGPAQVRAAVGFCATAEQSVYLRLESTPVPPEVAALRHPLPAPGHGAVLRPGGRTVALGAGPLVLGQLLRAADVLAAEGVDLTVVDLPWLNTVDPGWLGRLAGAADRILVVENHLGHGGHADTVGRALLELDLPTPPRLRGLGVNGVPVCGTDDEALHAHGLHAEQLAAVVRAWPSSPAPDRHPSRPTRRS
ncbi:transketolase C-terminal domain-containing protein [Micromonospora fluostatini]